MKSKDTYKNINHSGIEIIGIILIWIFLCITAGWVTDCADIDNYRFYYEDSNLVEYYISNYTNPGFYYIYNIFQSQGFSFESFHAIFYVFIMTFFVWFVGRYSRKPIVVLLLYIFVAFFGDVIQMKNALAMVFLYVALMGIVDKSMNYSKVTIAVILLLSATIHIGFMAYFVLLLYDKKINSTFYIFLSIALSLAGHSLLQMFSDYASILGAETMTIKADSYLERKSVFSVFACSFVFLVNYFTCKRFIYCQRNSIIHVDRLMAINVLAAIIIVFTSVNMVFFRLFRNMVLFNSVFIVNGYLDSRRSFIDKIILSAYFIIMSFFYFISTGVFDNVQDIFQSNSFF